MLSWDYIVKFVLIGDSGVGKSNLMIRLTENRYMPHHELTIGTEFGARILDIEGERMKLQIWDSAGQESFRSITRSYYRGATGALLVYDISRRQTFTNAKSWLDDLRTHADPQISICLVGNKSDLPDSLREVPFAEAEKWARENGVTAFVETSAKTGEKVEEAFLTTSRDIFDRIKMGKYDLSDRGVGIKVNQRSKGGSSVIPEISLTGKNSSNTAAAKSRCC